MSSFTLLQPHLMTTEQLRDHLKARFPSRDLSTMLRDELLKLFSLYAVPKARRNNSNTDVEMTPARTNVNVIQQENGHKRSRHQMITAPTVETVTNACKKIRLFNTAANTQKRPCQPSPMESDTDLQTSDPTQTKRKKITWP